LEYLKQFDSFIEFCGQSSHEKSNDSLTIASENDSPQERIESALKELNDELIDELMNEIMKISPYDFERLVVKLLISMGYGTMEGNKDAVTPKSGDAGIDGIVRADKFGFDSIYIQAKQWKQDILVSRPEIQKFIGALATTQGATKGIFITTSDFTKSAVEVITKQTQNKIILVNGKQLAKLMIEYNLGVSTVATYQVKRIDSDFFNEDI
ncbi:MAG: restriction endonuclease, partial [Ruminococcus sp.]|nr:restriction endonuclease [Ruminococcus sp.]